jgi:putative MATE family efflux protein
MFVGTLYAPIDLWCAGRLGKDAVAAVSFAAPLLFVLMAFSVGLSQAATALVARQLGAGEQEEARLTWSHALWLAAVVGATLTLLGFWLAPLILAGLGATAEVLRQAGDFAAVLFGGAAAFLLVASVNSALLAEGDGRPNFWFLTIGCAANVGLNFILMRIWGVAGIGAATVIVQIGGMIGLFVVARRRGWRVCGFGALRLPILGALLRQASPNVLNMLMIPVAVFLVTRQVATFGQDAVAAYGFALRIEHLFSMPLIGFVSSVLPLASRARGAGDLRSAFRIWITGLGLASLAALAASLLLVALAPKLCVYSGLTGSAAGHLGQYLTYAAVALPAYPVLFSVVFFMQALGRPEYGMWMGLGRHCLAPLVVLPLFAGWWGLQGVWIGITTIAWAAAAIALALGLRQRAAWLSIFAGWT